MATLELEGRAFALAPYKLGKLRRAAPFVDRINATAGALSTFEGMLNCSRDICEVLAIGLAEFDASLTADRLEEICGIDDMPALQTCLRDLMVECGLAPKGEAKAPSGPSAEGADLEISSEELSTS